jgi:hypothetical protein
VTEHQFRLLLSDEVPALLKLYDANILGFSLEVVLEPTIAWTGNTRTGMCSRE